MSPDDDRLMCPECGSPNIESTTMGWQLDGKGRDPNRATCCSCGAIGNCADWRTIRRLVKALEREAQWKVDAIRDRMDSEAARLQARYDAKTGR